MQTARKNRSTTKNKIKRKTNRRKKKTKTRRKTAVHVDWQTRTKTLRTTSMTKTNPMPTDTTHSTTPMQTYATTTTSTRTGPDSSTESTSTWTTIPFYTSGCTVPSEGKIERLFCFCDRRGGGVDGGVQVGDGDMAVGGEAYLLCLICYFDLYFRPIDLLFRFIGIITSQ